MGTAAGAAAGAAASSTFALAGGVVSGAVSALRPRRAIPTQSPVERQPEDEDLFTADEHQEGEHAYTEHWTNEDAVAYCDRRFLELHEGRNTLEAQMVAWDQPEEVTMHSQGLDRTPARKSQRDEEDHWWQDDLPARQPNRSTIIRQLIREASEERQERRRSTSQGRRQDRRPKPTQRSEATRGRSTTR